MGSRLTKEEIQAALNERHSPEVQECFPEEKWPLQVLAVWVRM